ncbi:MAG: hypothetical protein FWD31_00775, partial [Planctomycetaceae bacterium]|nr:hypothetical protein [Planctomycetaceae bacterium]
MSKFRYFIKRVWFCFGFVGLICFLGLAFAQNSEKLAEKALIEAFVNLQDVPQPFAQVLAELKTKYDAGELRELRQLSDVLQKTYFGKDTPDPSAIPYLIALIDADNSSDTVYGVGYFSLDRMTGVRYSQFQDGAFWKRWWERNKAIFPEEVQRIEIPELPKTTHGKSYEPYPEKMETLDGLLEYLCERFSPENFTAKNRKDVMVVQEGLLKFRLEFNSIAFSGLASAIAQYNDPKAIPYLIGAIDADNSYATVYFLGYFGLRELTGVEEYSIFHDGAFWRRWWEKNKANYPEEVQKIEIPDLPKTPHGKSYVPYPENTETIDGALEYLCSCFEPENQKKINSSYMFGVAQAIAQFDDPKAIPYLIGAIDADNSYDTVYGLGYFGLSRLTG